MIPHAHTDPPARERRKHDLLLASALARGQAVAALAEVGPRIDWVARGAFELRAWAAQPRVRVAGGTLGALLVLSSLVRWRGLRLVRWGLLAVRVWQIGRSVLTARRFG